MLSALHQDRESEVVVGTRRGLLRLRRTAIAVGTAVLLAPAAACAHGPAAPVASNYLARIAHVPKGVVAKVVDGDQIMWLKVPSTQTLVVVDYRGAPYLRFSRSGVEVNRNSEMYDLNQPTPFAVPSYVTAKTPPSWMRASSGHTYSWHDGRLGALATIQLTPGTRFVGDWRVPLLLDGRPAPISGGLWYMPPPSRVWFWPIVVLLACALAIRRVRHPRLTTWLMRGLALGGIAGVTVAAVGQQLHGRPYVSLFQQLTLVGILACVVLALARIVRGRAGYPLYIVVAFAALGEGLLMWTTLMRSFMLLAVSAWPARIATVLCLGCAVSLFAVVLLEIWDRPAALLGDRRKPGANGSRQRPDLVGLPHRGLAGQVRVPRAPNGRLDEVDGKRPLS